MFLALLAWISRFWRISRRTTNARGEVSAKTKRIVNSEMHAQKNEASLWDSSSMRMIALAAASFLAYGAGEALAVDKPQNNAKWEFDGRQCHARTSLDALAQGWGNQVAVGLKDVLELQKLIPDLKACTAFWQCVVDRDAGKVKHCHTNDRRWKALFK